MAQRRNLCNRIQLKGNSLVEAVLFLSLLYVYELYILYWMMNAYIYS